MFKPSCRTNKRNRYTECKQTQRRFEHKRRESHWTIALSRVSQPMYGLDAKYLSICAWSHSNIDRR